MCSQKRKNVIQNINNMNLASINIKHRYDDIYDNNISLKLWDDTGESYFQIVNIIMSN
jgi:hypothetical protein